MWMSFCKPRIFAFPTLVRSIKEQRKSSARTGRILCKVSQRVARRSNQRKKYLRSIFSSNFLVPWPSFAPNSVSSASLPLACFTMSSCILTGSRESGAIEAGGGRALRRLLCQRSEVLQVFIEFSHIGSVSARRHVKQGFSCRAKTAAPCEQKRRESTLTLCLIGRTSSDVMPGPKLRSP